MSSGFVDRLKRTVKRHLEQKWNDSVRVIKRSPVSSGHRVPSSMADDRATASIEKLRDLVEEALRREVTRIERVQLEALPPDVRFVEMGHIPLIRDSADRLHSLSVGQKRNVALQPSVVQNRTCTNSRRDQFADDMWSKQSVMSKFRASKEILRTRLAGVERRVRARKACKAVVFSSRPCITKPCCNRGAPKEAVHSR